MFDLRPHYGGGNEAMVTFSKGPMHTLPHSVHLTLQQATTDPCLHWRLLEPTSKSGSVSFGVSIPFSWVLVHTRFFCTLQESVSPILCKFWQLCGEVTSNLLQEGLCHTEVCCIQSPCPCGRPLLTCTSAGDILTLKCRSSSVSVRSPCMHMVLFEPSNHLCWV